MIIYDLIYLLNELGYGQNFKLNIFIYDSNLNPIQPDLFDIHR